ncbi:MAG TPA: ATP-grasp domain-containing protein, partial [Burkholderiaceae bacterium]
MTVLAVAALSARMLAEAATDDGFDVVALDLFGDADTRRACSQWLPIGSAAALRIDADRLLTALAALAQREGVIGWIAGGGFEGRPELLERGAALLPLIGTSADAVRRVRDANAFFGFLDVQGIAHPPVRMTAPADAAGWLAKDAHACGGWHIHRVVARRGATPSGPVPAHHYFQREIPGAPMSATFIANGRDASVLGFNQLIVRRFGTHPFVYCGAVGPVPLSADVAIRIAAAARVLARQFSLCGLASLDFMLSGDAFDVLEVNPRPPASMALYGKRVVPPAAQGIVAAHVRACLQGELPRWPAPTANAGVQGSEIVFASRPLWLDEPAARQ